MTRLDRMDVVGRSVQRSYRREYSVATGVGEWVDYFLVLDTGRLIQLVPYGLRAVEGIPPGAAPCQSGEVAKYMHALIVAVLTDECSHHPASEDPLLRSPPYDDVVILFDNGAWIANRITCNGESVMAVEGLAELVPLSERWFDYWSRDCVDVARIGM